MGYNNDIDLQRLVREMEHRHRIRNEINTECLTEEAVAYIRYSSHNQDGGISIEYQINEVLSYAAKNKIKIVGWYIDVAKSAREVAGRDDFIRLFEDVERGSIPPNVIIFATNRAFRNNGESHQYRDILRNKGITLHSATQNLDDKTSSGRLHINILATIDQYQSETISDFTSAATKYLITEGFSAGGRAPYGYKVETVIHHGKERAKLVINEAEAVVIREVFEGVAAGKNLGYIARALTEKGCTSRNGKPFHWQMLHKFLTNIVYKGERHYKMKNGTDAYSPDYCDPIVSKELFDKANKTHEENKVVPKGRHRKNIYPLTGKITCSCCGNSMTGSFSNTTMYYKCNSRHRHQKCNTKVIRKDLLDRLAFDAVKEHILSDKAIADITKKVMHLIKKAPAEAESKLELTARKTTLENEITEIVQMKLQKQITDSVMEMMTKDKNAELLVIERKLDALKLAVDASIDAAYIKKRIESIFDRNTLAEECTDAMLKELFHGTIKKIEVSNTQVVIHLRIDLSDNTLKTSQGFPEIDLSVNSERPKKKRGQ